jgi:hypothetical protein
LELKVNKHGALLGPIALLALIATLGFLSGCTSGPTSTIRQGDVSVTFTDGYINDRGQHEVQVHLSHSEEYSGMVQEVYLENGDVLVEYFPNLIFDYHNTATQNHWRYMIIYPADVEGTDGTRTGFAHLPQSKDGSATTTVGPGFNSWYQDKHETRGRVVRCKRDNPTIWSIRWEDGKAVCDIPKIDEED